MQDAIWRMMAWISRMISLSLFSLIALTNIRRQRHQTMTQRVRATLNGQGEGEDGEFE